MTVDRAPRAWPAVAGAGAAGLGCVVYAVVAHRAASNPAPGWFEASVFIAPLMGFALLPAWRSPHRAGWLSLWLVAACALVLLRDRLGASTAWVLLAQHVGINGLLGAVFARTLVPGAVPLVSRMARLVHGELSPRLVRYTRGVTWAWVAYFVATAVVSAGLFALAPTTVWSAFVNLFSLPLLGAMFVAEYAVRLVVIPRAERSGFLAAVTAWRRFSK